MANESQPQSRFGYLRGSGTAPIRRPEDKSTFEKLNELVQSGEIQPLSQVELARRQIKRLSQDRLRQTETHMRDKGHRVKERKLRRRKDPKPSLYERRIFDIQE